jgi:hypothetical protein
MPDWLAALLMLLAICTGCGCIVGALVLASGRRYAKGYTLVVAAALAGWAAYLLGSAQSSADSTHENTRCSAAAHGLPWHVQQFGSGSDVCWVNRGGQLGWQPVWNW